MQYKKLQKKLAEQGKPYDVGVGIDYDDVLQPKKESTAINEDLPSGVLDTVDAVGIKPLVGRLTEQRIQRLKDLGFVWSLRDDWQKVRKTCRGLLLALFSIARLIFSCFDSITKN